MRDAATPLLSSRFSRRDDPPCCADTAVVTPVFACARGTIELLLGHSSRGLIRLQTVFPVDGWGLVLRLSLRYCVSDISVRFIVI
jgi:hypothetical protein